MYFQRPYDFQSNQYYYQKRYSPKPVAQSPQSTSTSPYYVPSLSFSPSDSATLLETGLAAPVTDGPIDALTLEITALQSSDPIDSFFAAKRAFAARSVEDILGLIYERESILYDNLHKIDYETSGVKGRLFEINNWQWGMNPQMERVRFQFEHELRALEGDKRKEEVECWRDIARLRTELREAMREFSQEQRKAGLMGAQPKQQG